MPTPAASASAPAGGAAPEADSPLGFLAALVDQLLGDALPPATPQVSDFGTDVTPALPVVTDPPGAPAPASTDGAELLVALSDALSALADALNSGQPVDPDLVAKANDAAEAVASQLGIPLQLLVTPVPASDGATLTLDGDAPDIAPGAVGVPANTDAFGGLAATLASLLGVAAIDAPNESASVPPVTPSAPSTPPLPAIAALATRLADLGKSVAATSPDLAQKLEALGKVLAAAESQPDLLRNLTTASDTGATELDRLVKSLIDSRTAPAAPQVAAPALKTPAEMLATAASVEGTSVALEADPKDAALKLTVAATRATGEAMVRQASVDPKPASSDPGPQVTPKTEAAEAAPATPSQATAPTAPVAPMARTIQSAYQPMGAQAATLPQFAFEMVRQYQQGQSRFTIRLDPPELGRVDVKMHVDASGNVNARLTVERAETLDMFQRDHRTLERAIAQAGLDGNKTNLEFTLRQNPFSMSGQGGQGGNQYAGNFGAALESGEDETAVPSVILYRGAVSAGGVNMFV